MVYYTLSPNINVIFGGKRGRGNSWKFSGNDYFRIFPRIFRVGDSLNYGFFFARISNLRNSTEPHTDEYRAMTHLYMYS